MKQAKALLVSLFFSHNVAAFFFWCLEGSCEVIKREEKAAAAEG